MTCDFKYLTIYGKIIEGFEFVQSQKVKVQPSNFLAPPLLAEGPTPEAALESPCGEYLASSSILARYLGRGGSTHALPHLHTTYRSTNRGVSVYTAGWTGVQETFIVSTAALGDQIEPATPVLRDQCANQLLHHMPGHSLKLRK